MIETTARKLQRVLDDVVSCKTKIHKSNHWGHVRGVVLSQIGHVELSSTTNRWQKSATED